MLEDVSWLTDARMEYYIKRKKSCLGLKRWLLRGKITGCFFRGPKFSSQQLHREPPNHLSLQLQEIPNTFLFFMC